MACILGVEASVSTFDDKNDLITLDPNNAYRGTYFATSSLYCKETKNWFLYNFKKIIFKSTYGGLNFKQIKSVLYCSIFEKCH